MTLGSRRFSKQSPKSIKSGFGDQRPDGRTDNHLPPPSTQHSTATSRLKRVSDATVRRMSLPFSLRSSRPNSPGADSTNDNISQTSTRNSFSSRASRTRRHHPPTSRASSIISSRRSPRGPVSGGSHGSKFSPLPVFGISQRGYLASLVSLFSEGHNHGHNHGHDHDRDHDASHLATPVSTSASTATTKRRRTLGPYEYEVTSPAIFRFARAPGLPLYVGWPGTVNPPPEALLEFEMETLPMLERDFHGVSSHLGRQGVRITYELRMSGYATKSRSSRSSSGDDDDTVTLSPTIWILYRSCTPAATTNKFTAAEELHQAVAEILYGNIDDDHDDRSGVEIQEGGGRMELSSDRPLASGLKRHDRDSIHLSDGGMLSVHLEDCQEKYSVCGARCCVMIQDGDMNNKTSSSSSSSSSQSQTQSLSRIGGLLKINGKYILGVSTAHAMLDSSTLFKDSFDELQNGGRGGQQRPRASTHAAAAVDRDAMAAEMAGVSRWHDVTRDAAVDFLGVSMNSRGEMAVNRARPESATDFSLLRLRKMPAHVRNRYVRPGGGARRGEEEAVCITSTASASAAALDLGPVYVLCGDGEGDVVQGQLVWGTACFSVRGRNFRVRRIQTAKPLNAGVSGAWVVRGEVLYGVIVAVYEDEPFALMMTAERLFASIMGSAFSIRSVELWDGEMPDILKAYQAAAAEAAAGTDSKVKEKVKVKDMVRVETQPLLSPATTKQQQQQQQQETLLRGPLGGVKPKSTLTHPPPPEDEHAQRQRTTDDKKSGVVQTAVVPCSSSRPQTADHRGTRTDIVSLPPADVLAGRDGPGLVTRHSAAPSSSSSSSRGYKHRATAHTRTVSKSSDATTMMSRPVQTPDLVEDLPASRGGRPSTDEGEDDDDEDDDDNDSIASGAETYFTPRQSTFPKEQQVHHHHHHHITAELATIDEPTESLRGGGGSDFGAGGVSLGGGGGGGGGAGRRSSLQTVLGRTFSRRESSGSAPAWNSRENNYGIPPTGLSGRPSLFSSRRSSLPAGGSGPSGSISSSSQLQDGVPGPEGSDESTKASTQEPTTTTAGTSTGASSTGDDNSTIPPPGPDESQRPNVFRRLSSGKPLSYKKAQEKGRFNKDNNFGIPPRGL